MAEESDLQNVRPPRLISFAQPNMERILRSLVANIFPLSLASAARALGLWADFHFENAKRCHLVENISRAAFQPSGSGYGQRTPSPPSPPATQRGSQSIAPSSRSTAPDARRRMAARFGNADILDVSEDADAYEDVCVASELRLVHRLLWKEIEVKVPVSERDEARYFPP